MGALCLQDFLQAKHPQVYASCRYTAIDSSPALSQVQAKALQGHRCFRVRTGDACSAAPWGPQSQVRPNSAHLPTREARTSHTSLLLGLARGEHGAEDGRGAV